MVSLSSLISKWRSNSYFNEEWESDVGCTLNEELRIKDPEAYDIWIKAHICKLNYEGSAGNAEPVGAQQM